MRVTISAVDFDLDGVVSVYALRNTETSEHSRRFTKTQTLDGGVSVSDYGYSDGDTLKTIELKQDEETERLLKHIIEYHADVNVSTKDGLYLATLAYFQPGDELATLQLSIREKIA